MALSFGWTSWGLIVGVPLAAIILSEAIERLRRRKIPLFKALRQLRNVTLPLLSAVLICDRVFSISDDNRLLQGLQTLLWLSILTNGLLLLSTLLTTPGKPLKGKIEVPNLYLVAGRIAIVLGSGAYILAGVWQIDLASITSALGVGSLVVALALQDTLSNLVSGFLLLLDRPFVEGDWLQLGEIEAEVLEINWRSVRLRNRSRDIIIIPNGELGKATICNYTLLDETHAEKVFASFSYDDPPNQVRQMLVEAVEATADALDSPGPRVRVKRYGDYAIDYEVKFFLLDYLAKDEICSELRSHIYYIAKRYGFTMPYPITLEYAMDGATLNAVETVEPILSAFKSLTYFATLDETRLKKLAQQATLETYGAGETIVAAGRFSPGFFIIQSGGVSLTVQSKIDSKL